MLADAEGKLRSNAVYQLSLPATSVFGDDKKKKRSEKLMDRSKKVLHKANVALDEGRMKKEKRLFDRSERLKARAKKKGY